MIAFSYAALQIWMMSIASVGLTSADKHTVTVKPDGTCIVVSESVMPRKSVEQQIKMMEQWKKREALAGAIDTEDGLEANSDAPSKSPVPPDAPKIDDKPLSDEDLAKRGKEIYGQQYAALSNYADIKTDSKVEIQGDNVRIIADTTFRSLKDLLTYGQNAWSALGFDELRVEPDEKGNLIWTFAMSKNMARFRNTISQQWKAFGFKHEFKLELPGKILSSAFPNTKENETSILLDSQKPETTDALIKLYATNVVIVAQAGGLVLKEKLDSKLLQRTAYRPRGGDMADDLPIVDAGPGFLSEPVAITITSTYHFPEGKKYLGPIADYDVQTDGATIQVMLFAPKGRTIRSVSDLRVTKAVDDKGRALKTAEEDENSIPYMDFSNQAQDSAQLQVRLQIPEADAQTIEQVMAEAVVMSVGKWKETTFTDLKADAAKKLDLSSILPDAKLTVTKLTRRQQQGTIMLEVEGPSSVKRLDFQIKTPGEQHSASNIQQQGSTTAQDRTIRKFTLNYYSFNPSGGTSDKPFVLVVRFPEEIKRERVKFALKGLDLF
jgi:hypothetical protein